MACESVFLASRSRRDSSGEILYDERFDGQFFGSQSLLLELKGYLVQFAPIPRESLSRNWPLGGSLACLEWDERTGLPSGAAEYRADQVTLLSGLIHSRRTDPRIGEWLVSLGGEIAAGQVPHPERMQPPSDAGKKTMHAIPSFRSLWSKPRLERLALAKTPGQWLEARTTSLPSFPTSRRSFGFARRSRKFSFRSPKRLQ